MFYKIAIVESDKEKNQNKKRWESKESMIMKMKKFIAVLSVATMAAGLAVGCGSADSGSSDDKSSKGDWD